MMIHAVVNDSPFLFTSADTIDGVKYAAFNVTSHLIFCLRRHRPTCYLLGGDACLDNSSCFMYIISLFISVTSCSIIKLFYSILIHLRRCFFSVKKTANHYQKQYRCSSRRPFRTPPRYPLRPYNMRSLRLRGGCLNPSESGRK